MECSSFPSNYAGWIVKMGNMHSLDITATSTDAVSSLSCEDVIASIHEDGIARIVASCRLLMTGDSGQVFSRIRELEAQSRSRP